MTTDERLDRLTQRHEALAESLQLLTADVHDMQKGMREIMEGIGRLLHVAEIHEQRITRLEGGDA